MSQPAEKTQSPERHAPEVKLAAPATPNHRTGSWWRRELTLVNALAAVVCFGYAYLFLNSISSFWFHKDWTTDDALQQVYPFHEVQYPGLFAGDIVTEVMKGYLAPLHYWICYGVTMLTGDPVMMSHWVMLMQVVLTVGFLFVAIRSAAGTAPALIGIAWLLHDRNLMQRLTAGLPRGWSAVVISAFLCFVLRGNHRAVLATILAGCLLNPPATLGVAFAYGILLIWRSVVGEHDSRRAWRRSLLTYVLLSPLFALVTLAVVQRPATIGQMVSFEEASQMPEFSRPRGRFPFVPLNPAGEEVRIVGLEAFVNRFYNPGREVRAYIPHMVLGSLALLALIGAARRRVVVPAEIMAYGAGALIVYFLSRILAFRLYVPNRHLQIPMAIFFIAAFCIAGWKTFHRGDQNAAETDRSLRDTRLRFSWGSALALAALGCLVAVGSGWGLRGAANFNYSADKKGGVFAWIKQNTPLTAVIAGHPTQLDPVFLFGARRGYITTETGHPFYKRFNEEVQRRNEISLRAHWAASLEDLVTILEPEGITHFLFRRSDFTPEGLQQATFFPPLTGTVKQLTSKPAGSYAYDKLPKQPDPAQHPYVVFIDSQSLLIDVQALKAYMQSKGWTPPQAQGVRALRQLNISPDRLDGATVAKAPSRLSQKTSG